MKLYRYAGPPEIRDRAFGRPGTVITSCDDLRQWIASRSPEPLPDGTIPVTFVVDAGGLLRVADRRSEHVACAAGGEVRSAGEMFLAVTETSVEVVEVTNQSTGYCPEPESWPSVAAALDVAGIPHPGGFTREFVFRRCERCGQRNIVKDGVFRCGACGAPLPPAWNFGPPKPE